MANLPGNNFTVPPLQPFKKYEPPREQSQRPRFLDTPLGFGINAGLNVGAKFLDYWLAGKAQERTARLSDKYQQLAEERADKRNRELLMDQPFLSAEGRRKAGLNPYGDVVLPGMSGASSIATDAPAMPSFLDAQRLTLDGYVALKQLENDSKVANAEVNLKGAQAENIRGDEERADALHSIELDVKEQTRDNLKLQNAYQTMFNQEYSDLAETRKELAEYNLQTLKDAHALNEKLIINAGKDSSIKDAEIKILEKRKELLEATIFEKEIANTLGVRQYTFLTGRDYYTGEHIGTGKWQLDYDTADGEARAAQYNADMLEKELNQKDLELVLDRLFDVVEIVDIINDDVFAWMDSSRRRKLEWDIATYKKRDRNARDTQKLGVSLFTALLPYILKKL